MHWGSAPVPGPPLQFPNERCFAVHSNGAAFLGISRPGEFKNTKPNELILVLLFSEKEPAWSGGGGGGEPPPLPKAIRQGLFNSVRGFCFEAGTAFPLPASRFPIPILAGIFNGLVVNVNVGIVLLFLASPVAII
jgi:hypothetical protein